MTFEGNHYIKTLRNRNYYQIFNLISILLEKYLGKVRSPLFLCALGFEAAKKNSKAPGESVLMGGDWNRRWQKREKRGRLLEFSQNSLLFLVLLLLQRSTSLLLPIFLCVCGGEYFLSGHVRFLFMPCYGLSIFP